MQIRDVRSIINIFIKDTKDGLVKQTLLELKRVFKSGRSADRFLGLAARAEWMNADEETREKGFRGELELSWKPPKKKFNK